MVNHGVEVVRATLPLAAVSLILAWPYAWFLLAPASLNRLLSYQLRVSEVYPLEKTCTRLSLPLWKTLVLCIFAVVQASVWIGLMGWYIHEGQSDWWCALVNSIGWIWATTVPLNKKHPATPSLSLVVFYTIHLLTALYTLVPASFIEAMSSSDDLHFNQSLFCLSGSWLDLVACLTLLAVQLTLPVGVLPASLASDNAQEVKSHITQGSSPEDFAPLYQRLTISWLSPLIERNASKKSLEFSDLWKLSPKMQSEHLFKKWVTIPSGNLWIRVGKANCVDLMVDFFFLMITFSLNYFTPYCSKQIIDALSDPTPANLNRGYSFAVLALLGTLLHAIAEAQHTLAIRRASVKSMITLASSIYDKTLKRRDLSGVVDNEESKSKGSGVGKIVNLMTTDTPKIGDQVNYLYFIPGSIFELIVCVGFLYSLLGLSAFAGIFVLTAAIPLTSRLSTRSSGIQKRLVGARDTRNGIMNEFINSIRYIKSFAWEDIWMEKAVGARQNELHILMLRKLNQIVLSVIWVIVPLLVAISSFWSFVTFQDGELTVGIAFTSLTLFTMLRNPLNTIPNWIVDLAQTDISIRRVQTFLEEEEVKKSHLSTAFSSIGFQNATIGWNANRSTGALSNPVSAFQLHNLSVEFPTGKLSLVCGATGSGKTGLLLALLNEMDLITGSISAPKNFFNHEENGLTNSTAYTAQTPWLMQGTIKENILFGSAFDVERYQSVIEACALSLDLQQFEFGDATEIGARGITLSGGQKSRVSLARALYSRAKTVLIDDCLSALDSNTGQHVVLNALGGPLSQNRTIILVTHHIKLLLPFTHTLVHLVGGRINIQGTVDSLRTNGFLSSIVLEEEKLAERTDVLESIKDDTTTASATTKTTQNAITPTISSTPATSDGRGILIQAEKKAIGSVGVSTYLSYLRANTYTLWAAAMVVMLLSNNSVVVERWWIQVWTSSYSRSGSASSDRPLFYLGIYSLITLTGALLKISQDTIGFAGAYRASTILHSSMLVSVVRSPMRFFDITPLGRIVNRFSRDLQTIDISLQGNLQSAASAIVNLFSSLIVVSTIVPQFVIPGSIIFIVYYYIASRYVTTGRELQRLDSISRSPVLSGFSEVLDGIVTIRAFSSESRFLKKFQQQVDVGYAAFFQLWMNNRHAAFRFDVLGGLWAFSAMAFCLHGKLPAGIAAIAIVSASNFTAIVYWLCRNTAQAQQDLNSVERVVEYSRLPQEPQDGLEPPAYWPSFSNSSLPGLATPMISVNDLVVSYAPDLPLVLRGVSFEVMAGEKVACVGRTGSGKSSLLASLLRLIHVSSGNIFIDGQDISKITLKSLRSRITIIHQEPTLFTGTIRSNIDPFDQHSDDELIRVLQRVGLGKQAGSSGSSIGDVELRTSVSASGSNLSLGQRQLVSIARGILRANNLVIMDEATASVDFETDKLIQNTMREDFASATVLTVAHRLSTIIHYDKVLVLDAGKVVAFDTPYCLLQEKRGIFRRMCEDSGELSSLLAAAEASHLAKHQDR